MSKLRNNDINDHLEKLIAAYAPQRTQQTIVWFSREHIDRTIEIECGGEPERGTLAWERWRIAAEHVRNRELDGYRAASMAQPPIVYRPLEIEKEKDNAKVG